MCSPSQLVKDDTGRAREARGVNNALEGPDVTSRLS